MAAVRFESVGHRYYLDEVPVRHITQLLELAGLVDDEWYTEESGERGRCAHRLWEEFDLGAIEPDDVVSPYRGHLLAWVEAMRLMQAEHLEVEVPHVHARLRFGGRPDRVSRVRQSRHLAVLEGKSGRPTKAHPIQTALQAILLEPVYHLPADAFARYAIYTSNEGRARVFHHKDKGDVRKAREIVRKFCQ
jgi:hypothetical protein